MQEPGGNSGAGQTAKDLADAAGVLFDDAAAVRAVGDALEELYESRREIAERRNRRGDSSRG